MGNFIAGLILGFVVGATFAYSTLEDDDDE